MKRCLAIAVISGFAASFAVPALADTVTFGPASKANAEDFAKVRDPGGFDASNREIKADNGDKLIFARVKPAGVDKYKRKLVRECTTLRGGKVTKAEQMQYPNGNIGLMVGCTR